MLRWLRGFYLRMLPFVIALWLVALVWGIGTWLLVVLAVPTLIGLQGLTSLGLRIRREERGDVP